MRINKLRLILFFVLVNSIISGAYAQVLKGRLLYGHLGAPKVKVIIAPRTKSNELITEDNFFYGDNQELLQKMNAIVTVTNADGYYFFNDIKQGKYIIKVCEPYGVTYKFSISEDNYNFKLIPDLHAVSQE